MADNGGMVNLKYNCPHVAAFVSAAPLTIEQGELIMRSPCNACDDTGENWVCAMCRTVGCSRYVKGHMQTHRETSGHLIATSLRDLNTWCYECEAYIGHARVEQVRETLHLAKFGKLPETGNSKARFDAGPEELATARARIAMERTEYPAPREVTRPAELAYDSSKPGAARFGHANAEDLIEFEDSDEVLTLKVRELADLVRQSAHMVVYTGAGISTSAKIPDYRGPTGVWTMAARGKDALAASRADGGIGVLKLEQALPTSGHMTLKALMDRGMLKYLVSTNVDGLHRRSGIPEDKISELHGNCYREVCGTCKKECHRLYNVSSRTGADHLTGRSCEQPGCDGVLRDTIVNFGESLPGDITLRAFNESEACDLALVLGTSMLVSPACKLPEPVFMKNGKMVIVNLQHTPYDDYAAIRIYARTDKVLRMLARELGVDVPEYVLENDVLAPQSR